MAEDWKKTARLYNVYFKARAEGGSAECLGQIIADSVDEAERKAKGYFRRSLDIIRVEFVKKLYDEDGDEWA